jgi:hypothetical protein
MLKFNETETMYIKDILPRIRYKVFILLSLRGVRCRYICTYVLRYVHQYRYNSPKGTVASNLTALLVSLLPPLIPSSLFKCGIQIRRDIHSESV